MAKSFDLRDSGGLRGKCVSPNGTRLKYSAMNKYWPQASRTPCSQPFRQRFLWFWSTSTDCRHSEYRPCKVFCVTLPGHVICYPKSGMRPSYMMAKWFSAGFQWWIGIVHFFEAS